MLQSLCFAIARLKQDEILVCPNSGGGCLGFKVALAFVARCLDRMGVTLSSKFGDGGKGSDQMGSVVKIL